VTSQGEEVGWGGEGGGAGRFLAPTSSVGNLCQSMAIPLPPLLLPEGAKKEGRVDTFISYFISKQI